MQIELSILSRLRLIAWLLMLALPSLALAQQSNAPAAASAPAPGTFSGALPTEYPDWFKESFLEFADDVAEAADQGKRVMLLWHQDGCPYCNLLVERNLSQKNIVDLMQSRLDVVALNMWGDRDIVTVGGEAYTEKELAAALQVQFTPTLIFFDEAGKPILTLNGYLPPEEFLVALRYVTEAQERQASYRDFARENLPAAADQTGLIARPFFAPPPYNLRRDDDQEQSPLAVFFEQEHCPNCETMHTQSLRDQTTLELLLQYTAVQLDMWSDTPLVTPAGERTTARQWASDIGVNFAPTVILFDAGGREVIRSEAYFKTFHMQSLFDYVLSGAHHEQPSFQRYISERADHLVEQGHDINIWE